MNRQFENWTVFVTTEYTFANNSGQFCYYYKMESPRHFRRRQESYKRKKCKLLYCSTKYGPFSIVELKNNVSKGESGSIFTKKNRFVLAWRLQVCIATSFLTKTSEHCLCIWWKYLLIKCITSKYTITPTLY